MLLFALVFAKRRVNSRSRFLLNQPEKRIMKVYTSAVAFQEMCFLCRFSRNVFSVYDFFNCSNIGMLKHQIGDYILKCKIKKIKCNIKVF